MKLKNIDFNKKFETLYENTITRFQHGGFMTGDVVKFKKTALSHEKISGLSEQYKEMIKNAMATDLNLRLSVVKSIHPNSTGNYTGPSDAPADFYADVVIEQSPGLWCNPMTVPLEVLEMVDLHGNLPPVPDSLKRKSKSTKPENVTTSDNDRTLTMKNISIPSKKPTDGRSSIKKPEERK